MFAIANDRKSLWQWDLNQQLTVAGDCTEVHYLDRGAPSTLTVAVKDGKADIPNILLQKAGRLVVYAYIIDAQDHHTKVCETFGIAPRPKPAEYVYTETEVKTWSDLQSQIGDLDNLVTEEKNNLVAAINEAARSGGGAGAWYVTLTPNDDGSITADKTMEEIEAAYQAGYAVYCIFLFLVIFADIPIIAPLTIHRANEKYTFCGVGTFDSKLYSFQFELTKSGWTVLQKEIPQKSDIPAAYILPKATANALGGVKADPATADDTQPVRIDDSGKLVTAARSGSDISLGLTSAAVGQIIKVKAIDASGKPTAWEAAYMPSGGSGHWETVLDTVWEQDVINPTAFDSETGIFTCAEGELNNLELNKEYVFFQQCAVKGVAYNTILVNENLKVTKLSDTTFSINVTPPATFVPTNVKFSKGACLAITDIDAKKIRLTLDGQFTPTATLYNKPFYEMNVPFFGQNTGYAQIRNAYQAYQQVTAEVESPYRIVGEILCGFNAPSSNGNFHFKNNSFCCPLVPTEFPGGNTYILTSDGTKIAKLYSTSNPWLLGGGSENTAISNDCLKIISGTKVKLERWVE